MKPYLSVVIPAYNEEKNLKKGVLHDVEEYLKKVEYPYEVILVDDGSTDKTAKFVTQFIKGKPSWRLIKASHGGKALAVMRGLLLATGEIALFTDMDQATPLSEVEKFFPYFEKGFSTRGGPASGWDIVIGSRKGRQGAPTLRKLAAWGFAALRSVILDLAFLDTQCGFKAFNVRAREAVFPKLQGIWDDMRAKGAAVHAGFDVETLFLARKRGLRIAEAPVKWHYVGTERVQLIRDSIDAVRDLLRIRVNDVMGKYDR